MKLKEIRIKNFRCLADVTIPVDDNLTVLVGPNNSGKTASLEALELALSTSVARVAPFDEYDYHMCQPQDLPETSQGIIIELWFNEEAPSEWPDSLIQVLNEIIQTDPYKDIHYIGLRLSSKYDDNAKEFDTKREFLTVAGEPITGKGSNPNNLRQFLSFVRFFYLSANRDSDREFSTHSQFWGRILRNLKIDETQKKALAEDLASINDDLLNADERLKQLTDTLNKVHNSMATGTNVGCTTIQALPLKPWELMSKAQVTMKSANEAVDIPLSRHGHGMQSLAVLYLFQAYIDILLKPNFRLETEAILALEEPEAHLHPHSARALANNLTDMSPQKLVTCHSPYFIQEIPSSQIRLFRREGASTKVLYVKKEYTCKLPANANLTKFCEKNKQKYVYDMHTNIFHVKGKIDEKEYKELLKCYPSKPNVQKKIKSIMCKSQQYINSQELEALDIYAKRTRGEILYARSWLLCEGQSDYEIIQCFAKIMNKPLDQFGVTVIDFRNNGSIGPFVKLARAFEIPWVMICDNDVQGKSNIKEIKKCGVNAEEINKFVRLLPGDKTDMERFLLTHGFLDDYVDILSKLAITGEEEQVEYIIARHTIENEECRMIYKKPDVYEIQIGSSNELSERIDSSNEKYEEKRLDILVGAIKKDKVGFTQSLVKKLQSENTCASRIPKEFIDIINLACSGVS